MLDEAKFFLLQIAVRVCILAVTGSYHLQKFSRQKGIGSSSYGNF